jgi:hypothetical protein
MDISRKGMGVTPQPAAPAPVAQPTPQPVAEVRLFNSLVRPSLLENKTNEEAAGVGVVASKKQAKDPRYSMSLTKDVRPGQIKKNLDAFSLEDTSQAIAHTAKSLENPPKVMQHRAKRDQEREEQLKSRNIAKKNEAMLPKSAFAGSDKNKLGPAAHLKGKMKRPAQQGDLVGGMEEGWKDKLAAAGLAGAMALGAGGAQARVTGQEDPGINRLTGKPNVTQPAANNTPTKADASTGFNKEWLQKAADPNRIGRYMISVEKAQELLKKMDAVDEAKKKGVDGKACWKGYRYAGTKNGKDRCVPVSEDVEQIMAGLIEQIIKK